MLLSLHVGHDEVSSAEGGKNCDLHSTAAARGNKGCPGKKLHRDKVHRNRKHVGGANPFFLLSLPFLSSTTTGLAGANAEPAGKAEAWFTEVQSWHRKAQYGRECLQLKTIHRLITVTANSLADQSRSL